ncbi:MAG TPA: hypothetical protein VLC93_01010, partial [Myxococcota bacterium]|nr:hypothetical protein [Myxococcota bacterium]
MNDLTPPFPLQQRDWHDDDDRAGDFVPTPADSFRILIWQRGSEGRKAFLSSESYMSGHPVWSSGDGIYGLRQLEAVRNAIADLRAEAHRGGSSRFYGHAAELRVAFPGQIWSTADRLSEETVAKLEGMLAMWLARI